MKKLLIITLCSCISLLAISQEKKQTGTNGFKKENLFTGGSVTASFFTGGGVLGLSPHFGYSITRWLDVAALVNFTYQWQRDEFSNKYRQTNIGPGAFMRIFPVEFIYAQVQYEHNFIKLKYLPNYGGPSELYKADVNSLLLGAGYTSGREPGKNTYYYFSVLFDVLKAKNSPYVDSYGRLFPVVKAGFNIALFRGKDKGR